jgi:hypothetical protein
VLLVLLAFLDGPVACKSGPIPPPAPPPANETRAAAKSREKKAAKLAQSASNYLFARHFQEAVDEASAVLALTPQDSQTLLLAYRVLGYGYGYLGTIDEARKWLKLYAAYSPDCDQINRLAAFLGTGAAAPVTPPQKP